MIRAQDIYNELKNAEKCLNMSSYLHMLYLVTPYDMIEVIHPDWDVYSQRIKQLSFSEVTLLEILGFNELYISKRVMGYLPNEV